MQDFCGFQLVKYVKGHRREQAARVAGSKPEQASRPAGAKKERSKERKEQ